MHEAIPPLLLARVILFLAWKFLVFAAPFLAVCALWWIVNRTEQIINYLFPHLEWERSLGWLNIRAERRAATALRWIGYGVYVLLAAALLGIVWGAEGVNELPAWPDPWIIGDVMIRGAVLAICLGAWVFYLGAWLVPKLRTQREEAALRRFRAEMVETDRERERRSPRPPSRVKTPLRKPRINGPVEMLTPDRHGRLRPPPGG